MKWSESLDPALHLPALEKLAGLTNRPTEAAVAREKLAVVRENAAIAAIESLGGHVQQQDRALAVAVGADMSALQVVIGPQWKGGVDGLKHVGDVRRASTLSLWSAPLDDAAVPRLLELKHIQRLELYGMAISPEGVAKIEKEAPQLMLDVRPGGARLGVRGLIVEEVVPNSAAEKGGIVVGDTIVKFEGTELTGETPTDKFQHLTREIAKCQPGDERTIEVLRQGKPVALKVTFDRWGDDPTTGRRGGEAADEDDLFQPIPQQPRIIIQQQRR
jgi:hypothetical protein